MDAMGYIRFGYLLVNWRNTSDGGYITDDKKPLREGDEEAMRRVKDKGMAGGDAEGEGEGEGVEKRAIERWDTVEDRDTGSVLAKREKEAKMRQGPAKKVEKRGSGGGMIVKGDAIVA
jgi:hypothetical protein